MDGSAANGTVAHEAELGVVVAGLQAGGGLVAAVVVAVDAVVTGTKLSVALVASYAFHHRSRYGRTSGVGFAFFA